MHPEIAEYINALPDHRAVALGAIHHLIVSMYPRVKQSLLYKMPTYTLGENWIAMGSQKAHYGVYTCSLIVIQPYLDKHPEIDAGKGCLRFSDTQKVVMADLRPVIQAALTLKP